MENNNTLTISPTSPTSTPQSNTPTNTNTNTNTPTNTNINTPTNTNTNTNTNTTTNTSTKNNPINVLCLHGCNQTQAMFESLMKNYVKLGEKQYNLKFHFTEAKYDHPSGGKTWYKRPLNVSQIGSIPYDKDLTDDTLNDLNELIDSLNVEVLLGFSQGANVIDTFLTYKGNSNIKCAVIMSGYSLVDLKRVDHFVPALGVISDSDDIVPSKLNPTQLVIKHDKGHKLPTQNTLIRQICLFMQNEVHH